MIKTIDYTTLLYIVVTIDCSIDIVLVNTADVIIAK